MHTPTWRHESRQAGLGLVCMALLMGTPALLTGQEKAPPDADKASSSAQPVKRDYRFEVVSIHPSGPQGPSGSPPGPKYTPGRFRSESETIVTLAVTAFNVRQSFQIEVPRSMGKKYFAINATAPEGATKADVPILMQHLLEDRFGLKYHNETRQMAGYELVVAKSDPRLAKAVAPASDISTESLMKGGSIVMKNGVPQFKDSGSGQLYYNRTALWQGRDRTMKTLAEDLARELGVPVVDSTGLNGGYDYVLRFTPQPRPGVGGNVVSPGGGVPVSALSEDGASTPLENPFLRDALEEQLGLKLQPVKSIPVKVVVLDSANEEPTEN